MKLLDIDLTFNYRDGKRKVTIKATIDAENGAQWNQWGADTRELGENVDLLHLLAQAVREFESD